MEIVLDKYLKTVEEIQNGLDKSRREFDGNIKLSCSWYEQTKKNNIASMMIMMNSKMSAKKEEYHTDSLNYVDETTAIPTVTIMESENNEDDDELSDCKPTVKTWWESFILGSYPETMCSEYLHCSRKTYVYLIKTLRPHINPKWKITKNVSTSKAQRGVTTTKQVALTLYRLSCRSNNATISGIFDIHRSTVSRIFYKVIWNIYKHLMPMVIKMPSTTEAREISKWFEEHTKIPQIIGVITTTHIPISCERSMESQFINSEKYHSFIAQTIVDSNNCFRDLSIQHPGSVDDIRVLEESNIYKLHHEVLPKGTKNLLGIHIAHQLVAPANYPLLPWLLKEYSDPMSEGEFIFNDHLQVAINHATTAVNKLRARFNVLCQPADLSYKMTPQVVAACCVLHNICEKNGDILLQAWLDEAEILQNKYPQPARKPLNEETAETAALQQRNAIKDHLEVFGQINEDDV